MKTLTVRFVAEFETTIIVKHGDSISDLLSDVDIPESQGVKYVADTYEVQSVTDSSGDDVDYEE